MIDFGKVNSVVVNATGGPAYGLFAQMEGSRLSGDVQSLTVNSNSNAYGVYANRSGDVQLALSGNEQPSFSISITTDAPIASPRPTPILTQASSPR